MSEQVASIKKIPTLTILFLVTQYIIRGILKSINATIALVIIGERMN